MPKLNPYRYIISGEAGVRCDHVTCLPRQELTRSAVGCPSGTRGFHARGSNPHAGSKYKYRRPRPEFGSVHAHETAHIYHFAKQCVLT